MSKKIFKNKKILILLIFIIFLVGFFLFQSINKNKEEIKYNTTKIEKGNLIKTVSGSGQVVSLEEIDLKSKAQGEVVYLNLENGKKVNKGDLLLQLDTTEAQKDVWDAEINLKNAELSTKDLSQESQDSLDNIYNNVLNALTTNYQDLSNDFPNIEPMFISSSYNSSDEDNNDMDYYLRLVKFIQKNTNTDIDLNYWDKTAEQKYLDIEQKYELVQTQSWFLNNNSAKEDIENALNKTYDNNKIMLDLVRQSISLSQKYQYLTLTHNVNTPISSSITDNQIDLLTDLLNSLVSNSNTLNTLKTSLDTAKDTDKKVEINSETQNLTILQKELDLDVAKENLNNHFVYSPFSGIIASVNNDVKINEDVSNNATLATIVTNQQIAEITLNEIDVAKIKVGQKATITFDAIDDLTLTGSVVEVDEIGTTNQGVVTYDVKIEFDQQDERIKQGMSLSTTIITDIQTNVYILNSGAIKNDTTSNYVEVLVNNSVEKKYIETGLSNDTETEIVSGLDENDNIIISSSSVSDKKTSNGNSAFDMRKSGMNNMSRMR